MENHQVNTIQNLAPMKACTRSGSRHFQLRTVGVCFRHALESNLHYLHICTPQTFTIYVYMQLSKAGEVLDANIIKTTTTATCRFRLL